MIYQWDTGTLRGRENCRVPSRQWKTRVATGNQRINALNATEYINTLT